LLQGIVEKRNTLPILSSILLDCSGGNLKMYATDLEVSIRTISPINVVSEGKSALPGKRIYEILKSFKEGSEIEISEEESNKVVIKGDSSYFIVFGYPSDDFPEIPVPSSEEFTIIPYDKLISLIERVDYILTQELRYTFGGALLRISQNLIEMVATDGNRLSYTKENLNIDVKEEINIILPKKILSELKKIEGDSIKFGQDNNNLFFEIGNTLLISRKLDTEFPPWRRAIPTQNNNIAILNREELKESIKRVSIIASEKGRAIKFIFSGNTLQLKAFNPEMGEAFDMINIEYRGEPLEIIFNSSFISEFLSSLECEKIRIEMLNQEKAALLKPEDDLIEYLYVVMPIKL
ncbi:MAG: DNA polymerase III subunit beta, partial [Candidatus Aminicenantia bacterium]